MGMFDRVTKIQQKSLYVKEDLNVDRLRLNIDDRFIMRQQQKRKQAWPYIPSLTLPLTVNGKYQGEFYLISSRTGEPLDPLGKLTDEWKGKKLWTKIVALATEEHHKVTSKVHQTQMQKMTVPLAWGAAFATVLVFLTAFMSRGA